MAIVSFRQDEIPQISEARKDELRKMSETELN
jgi:hypothetical protein